MNIDNINFSNYYYVIDELGAKENLTDNESKMLARALTLEKIEYDCMFSPSNYDSEDYYDEDYDDGDYDDE